MPTLLVLTALRYEALAIARRLRQAGLSRAAAEVQVIGPRCVALESLIITESCRGIVMAGLGGGLDAALAIGDVVVDERSDLTVPNGPWRRGKIHTSTGLLASATQKQSVFATTRALVVDMENGIARDFAAARGIPFFGVRAVSDRATDELDPSTLRWVDPAGGLRPARVAADLLRRPWTVAAVWRLGHRSRVAVRNLADAVSQIVASTTPVTPAAPTTSGMGNAPPCGSTA